MTIALNSKRIQLSGITKSYGATKILSGLDLNVEPGEFVAMLGPSGSGKTTVLKLIAGFEEPDSGTLLIGDRDMRSVPPERRNIGVVFQNYSLFPHMNVAANVAFPLRMRGVSRAEREIAVTRALQQVALSGYETRMPSELSGGQQQRVAIARAIVFEPDVLLMDEPLGALDRRLRGDLQLEIKALHDRLGITIVYVTHDQEEALSMSDRLVVFNRGGIEQIGRPRDVYRRPRTLFVADFLGDSVALSGRLMGRTWKLDGTGTEVNLPSEPGIAGRAKLLWRSDMVSVIPSVAEPLIEGSSLIMPAIVETAAYNGNVTRLRVRLATHDSGIVIANEATEATAGDRIAVAFDLTTANVLADDP